MFGSAPLGSAPFGESGTQAGRDGATGISTVTADHVSAATVTGVRTSTSTVTGG